MKLLNFFTRSIRIKANFFTPLKKTPALPYVYSYLLHANYSSSFLLSKKNMSNYIYPNNTPIIQLDCEAAFNELTKKEKHYAHFLSKASWYGGLIDLLQTSSESPLIFILVDKLFHNESVSELKQTALNKCGFTEDDYTAFLIYISGIFSNMGNYKGFGDTKFIPNLPTDKFEKLVLSSKFAAKHPHDSQQLLSKCLELIYSLKDKECCLGFPYKGTTTYLSKNITEEDLEAVKKFLKNKNLEPFNTRLFKTVDENGRTIYEIRLASVLKTDSEEEKNLISTTAVNGHNFVITRGDYSKLLKLVNEYLSLAKDYAANEIVNKKMSAKFSELVKSAETLLPLLPWPKAYEIDTFLQPDFTSLDVLTYACSGVPAGICIPNYNEIRQSEGFKNVSLGNTIHVKMTEPPNFLNKTDQDLVMKYRNSAFEINVGLHELLGHGSGKLFKKEKDGSFNFDNDNVVDFLTDKKVSSWYEEGETYDSVFGSLGSSYEECRAESVALYLCDSSTVLKIFGYEGEAASDITYIVWLSMALKGLEGLEMYDPKTDSWLQAHSQARFVILQVMLESGEDFVKIEKVTSNDKPDLLLSVDRSKLASVGKKAIGNFLGKLQLYRSTANLTAAKEMYDKYSLVASEENKYPFLEYREIVMDRKKPRRMFVQANTFLENDEVKLKTYPSTPEGMIQSWVERFQSTKVDDILEELWEKDKKHF